MLPYPCDFFAELLECVSHGYNSMEMLQYSPIITNYI